MLLEAIEAAKKAGQCLKERFRQEHQIFYKDAHNIVSEADLASERIILDCLSKQFPEHSFFSEEKGMQDNHSDYLWIIDPLDGTTNFTHHFPYFCVSIALAYQMKPLFGVIYQPVARQLYTAQLGKGAFLNNKPIRVNNLSSLDRAVGLLIRGADKVQKERSAKIFSLISKNLRTVRILGSVISICSVASGQLDLMVVNGSRFYDYAAAALIAQEAGAKVTDFQGNPWKIKEDRADLLIANPELHRQFLPHLKTI